MRDAFDVDGIRASMPGLQDTMKLESMRNVLDELDGHMETEYNATAFEPADISMHDAPLDLDEETNVTASKESSPVEKADAPETDKDESSKLELAHPGPQDPADESMSLAPAILSPTRLGAQQALDSPVVEIKMPIPAPWHHNLPYILSTYLQLAFNAGLLLAAGMLARAYKADVEIHMSETAATIARKAAQCAELYVQNECRPGLRRPALEEYCEELEECMERDPEAVKSFSAHAALLAGFINDFLDPLSFKAIFLLVAIGLAIAFVANYLFGFVRARTYYGVSHPPQRSLPEVNYRLSAKRGDIWKT